MRFHKCHPLVDFMDIGAPRDRSAHWLLREAIRQFVERD